MSKQVKFRVHFENGTHLDVMAQTPDIARRIATGLRPGPVSKIKLVRE